MIEIINYQALESSKGLKATITQAWGLGLGVVEGSKVLIANYCDQSGKVIAQKVKPQGNQQSHFEGDFKSPFLFGKQMSRGANRRSVLVTASESEAVSYCQLRTHPSPVVAVPSVKQAVDACRADLEFLEGFQQVTFLFPEDAVSQGEAVRCVQLLAPRKGRIARLAEGSINDHLKRQEADKVIAAVDNARPWSPEGIVDAADYADSIDEPIPPPIAHWPFKKLDALLGGIRAGELTILTGGTGQGKTLVSRMAAHAVLVNDGLSVGMLMMEETKKKTARSIVAIDLRQPVNRDFTASKEDIQAAKERTLLTGRLHFIPENSSLSVEEAIRRIRLMVLSARCGFIVLDHISIIMSGTNTDDERKAIDSLMHQLAAVTVETGVHICAVCHLSKDDGTPPEEGGRVMLNHLRGSGAIKQLAVNVIAAERDQQGDNRLETTLRLLKCREFGENVGGTVLTRFNLATGLLEEVPDPPPTRREFTEDDQGFFFPITTETD